MLKSRLAHHDGGLYCEGGDHSGRSYEHCEYISLGSENSGSPRITFPD